MTVETDEQRAERQQRLNSSLFAGFLKGSKSVVSKGGWVEREIAGDRYRTRLWCPLKALEESDMLLKRYGDAITMSVLGFVRYSTKRTDEYGNAVTHMADVGSAEAMFVHASQALVQAAGEDHGIHKLVLAYVPGEVQRRVSLPGGREVWIDVIPTKPEDKSATHEGSVICEPLTGGGFKVLQDLRTTRNGQPIGYTEFYRGGDRFWILPALVYWIFAENIGGFISAFLSSRRKALATNMKSDGSTEPSAENSKA